MAGPGGRPWSRFLLAGLIVFGLVLLLFGWFERDLSAAVNVRVVALAGFLVLLLSGLIARMSTAPRAGWSKIFGEVVIWLAVGLVLLAGYGYRNEMRQVAGRLLGELDPALGRAVGGGSAGGQGGGTGVAMLYTMANDGEFHIEGKVGGVPVRFILDTGASDVMLSPSDARRLGFDPAALAYTRRYQTANGEVMGAPVVLPSLDIGAIHMKEVAASVLQTPTEGSLLGMSFLRRLKGYQVQGPNLTLIE